MVGSVSLLILSLLSFGFFIVLSDFLLDFNHDFLDFLDFSFLQNGFFPVESFANIIRWGCESMMRFEFHARLACFGICNDFLTRKRSRHFFFIHSMHVDHLFRIVRFENINRVFRLIRFKHAR